MQVIFFHFALEKYEQTTYEHAATQESRADVPCSDVDDDLLVHSFQLHHLNSYHIYHPNLIHLHSTFRYSTMQVFL